MEKIFVLFTARHDVPINEGALCESFDFTVFEAIKTANWQIALNSMRNGSTIKVIVTGLTPTITEFITNAIKWCSYSTCDAWEAEYVSQALEPKAVNCPVKYNGHLILMHFNKDTSSYVEQSIF